MTEDPRQTLRALADSIPTLPELGPEDKAAVEWALTEIDRLRALNAELVEALEATVAIQGSDGYSYTRTLKAVVKACDALAKVRAYGADIVPPVNPESPIEPGL